MRRIPFLYSALFIVSISFATTTYAEQENDNPDLGGGFTESAPWKEGQVDFPDYPLQENLIKVEVDRVDMPFDFYLDSKSLVSLKNDALVRYTVVVQSNSGAKNVLFEGIRCSTGEYRTYAYGTLDNSFVKATTSSWKYIEESGFMVHRYNFFKYYMCSDEQGSNPIDEILRKIRYPEDFQISGERDD